MRWLPLLLLFAVFPVMAAQETSVPSNFSDPQAIAANESLAFDADPATAANISAVTGNLSLFSFSDNGNPPSEDIVLVDLGFGLNASGFADDTWALEYSNDSGTTWYVLRAPSSDNLSQNLSYPNVAGPAGDWDWTSISSLLQTRLRYVVVGGADASLIRLFEVWANVSIDREGPSIDLLSPSNGTNYSGLTQANFSYNVTDILSGIANCSLLIDGTVNQTNLTVSEGEQNNFTLLLDDGSYLWSVSCFDNSSVTNSNVSLGRILRVDNAPPSVLLLSPGNGSTQTNQSLLPFLFSFNDVSPLANCSLYLNGSLNATINGTQLNWPSGEGRFLVDVQNGPWDWNVSCTDIYNRTGAALSFPFTQAANDPPLIHNLSLPSSITLTLGDNTSVQCSANVTDNQGQGTIDFFAGFLHRSDLSWDDPDETSSHHTDNCTGTGINATTIQYDCFFNIPYYARTMNWTCTLRAEDEQGVESFAAQQAVVEPLYAFDVLDTGIAYGSVSAGNTSSEVSVQIENLGNTELDMALDGYAQSDGDGLAIICDVGNTTIGDERYHASPGTPFPSMVQLTDDPVQIDALNLLPRNDSFNGIGTIYWRIRLGVPQRGNCTGFVTFTGLQS